MKQQTTCAALAIWDIGVLCGALVLCLVIGGVTMWGITNLTSQSAQAGAESSHTSQVHRIEPTQ